MAENVNIKAIATVRSILNRYGDKDTDYVSHLIVKHLDQRGLLANNDTDQ